MQIQVIEIKRQPPLWSVKVGKRYVVVFSGPLARADAVAHAATLGDFTVVERAIPAREVRRLDLASAKRRRNETNVQQVNKCIIALSECQAPAKNTPGAETTSPRVIRECPKQPYREAAQAGGKSDSARYPTRSRRFRQRQKSIGSNMPPRLWVLSRCYRRPVSPLALRLSGVDRQGHGTYEVCAPTCFWSPGELLAISAVACALSEPLRIRSTGKPRREPQSF